MISKRNFSLIGVMTVALVLIFGQATTGHSEPYVLDPFGTTAGRAYPHTGVDYGIPIGTPVLAPSDGTVVYAKYDSDQDTDGGGHPINVQHTLSLFTWYQHLNVLLVQEGDEVKRGDVIALSGHSGTNAGDHPHLHFQVVRFRNLNPYPNYWFGNEGRPLAFDTKTPYPGNKALFTHPVAFGVYLETAKLIASEKLSRNKGKR